MPGGLKSEDLPLNGLGNSVTIGDDYTEPESITQMQRKSLPADLFLRSWETLLTTFVRVGLVLSVVVAIRMLSGGGLLAESIAASAAVGASFVFVNIQSLKYGIVSDPIELILCSLYKHSHLSEYNERAGIKMFSGNWFLAFFLFLVAQFVGVLASWACVEIVNPIPRADPDFAIVNNGYPYWHLYSDVGRVLFVTAFAYFLSFWVLFKSKRTENETDGGLDSVFAGAVMSIVTLAFYWIAGGVDTVLRPFTASLWDRLGDHDEQGWYWLAGIGAAGLYVLYDYFFLRRTTK